MYKRPVLLIRSTKQLWPKAVLSLFGTPQTLVAAANTTSVATFTAGHSFQSTPGLTDIIPNEGTFVSWPQTGAILKDAPHPEGAKLLHNFILSEEYQRNFGWSPRKDMPAPTGAQTIVKQPNTHAAKFAKFMADRENVERVRFYYETRLGTAQGLSPLEDNL